MSRLHPRSIGLGRRAAVLLAVAILTSASGCESPSPSAVGDGPKGGVRDWTPIAGPAVAPPLVPPIGVPPIGVPPIGVPPIQSIAAPKPAPPGASGVEGADAERTPGRDGDAEQQATVLREPWSWGDAKGTVVRTRHYEIYTTISDEGLLRDLPLLMEGALVQYRTALVELPPPPKAMRSMIFDRRSDWAAYTKRKLPQEADLYIGIGRGGYTTGGESVLFNLGRSDTFVIAVHEGWHQYTQTTFRDRLPTWLEEGIACWMEGHRFHRQALPVFAPWRNMERYGALRDAVRDDRLVPLADLLRGTPQEALGEGRSTLLGYYAQVWALVHFLHDGEGGRYRESLRRIVRDAAKGDLVRSLMTSEVLPSEAKRPWALSRNGRWAAMAYFNRDLAELEAQYLAFVRRAVADGGRSRIWRGLSPVTDQ